MVTALLQGIPLIRRPNLKSIQLLSAHPLHSSAPQLKNRTRVSISEHLSLLADIDMGVLDDANKTRNSLRLH